MVDFIRKAQRFEPCIATFSVIRHTTAEGAAAEPAATPALPSPAPELPAAAPELPAAPPAVARKAVGATPSAAAPVAALSAPPAATPAAAALASVAAAAASTPAISLAPAPAVAPSVASAVAPAEALPTASPPPPTTPASAPAAAVAVVAPAPLLEAPAAPAAAAAVALPAAPKLSPAAPAQLSPPSAPLAAEASPAVVLADFLSAKGCLFWNSDLTEVRESVFTAVGDVLFNVTPALKDSLLSRCADASPLTRRAILEAVPLLRAPTQVEQRSHQQVLQDVRSCIRSIESNDTVFRVLVRDAWHPVRSIIGALKALHADPDNKEPGADQWPRADDISDGCVVPGLGPKATLARTPACHQPLVHALSEAPPPEPWQACTSNIVQLSMDWFVGTPSVYGPSKAILRAAVDIEQNEANLPFPAGIMAVRTTEWLRQWRWYLWRLPRAPRNVQLAAHKDMRQALLAALRSGASPATIGTPAFGAAASVAGESQAQVADGATTRGRKRGARGRAVLEPAMDNGQGGEGSGAAKQLRRSGRGGRAGAV